MIANVLNDEGDGKTRTLSQISGGPVTVVGTQTIQVSSPTLGPALPRRSVVLSPQPAAASPMAVTAPTLQLPGKMMTQTRSRVNSTTAGTTTAMTTSSSGAPSPIAGWTGQSRRAALSFDVPATPESAWVGGSTGSAYNFFQPGVQQGMILEAPGKALTTKPVTVMGAGNVAGNTFAANAGMAPASVSVQQAGPAVQGGYGGMYAFPGGFMPQSGMPGGFQMQYMQMPVSMPYGQAPGMMQPTYAPNMAAAGQQGVVSLDLGSLLPSAASSGLVTTVMLRNIPLKYNREALLADADSRGFACTYDFFYLPIDFHTGNNMGYAFINFIDEPTVARFRAAYDGLQLSADSAKICQVSDAKAQGQLKNIDQYRNSSVMSMEDRYQPVVFQNGVRQPFPPPTRSLKPVKPRARAP